MLMSMGLFASLFAILRTVTLRNFTKDDFFRGQVMPTLWGTLELEVALIAATVPTLRNFVQRALMRLGSYFYEEQSETMVRGRLVELGFLVEGEVEEIYTEGKEWEKGGGAPREGRKRRDEFGDMVDSVMEEKERDFEKEVEVVMVAVGEGKEKTEKTKRRTVG